MSGSPTPTASSAPLRLPQSIISNNSNPTASLRSDRGSPRGMLRENPFSCFEAFACLKPIVTTDAKGQPSTSAEVLWSYPYKPRQMLPRFGSIDKMAFPTFDHNASVAPLSGDGTFIFVITMEGKARRHDGFVTAASPAVGSSSMAIDFSDCSCSDNDEHDGADASESDNNNNLTLTNSNAANEAGSTPSKAGRRRLRDHEHESSAARKKAPLEFKQLYGHCISTVNGEVYVFLSQHMWVGFFRSLLLYYKGNGPDAGRALLKSLYAVPTPMDIGGSFGLRFGGSVLKRPLDAAHLKGIDADPLLLLKVFTDTQLLEIVSALLLVETVIIAGPDFGVVSKVIVALRALIAVVDPQCWVYAPVLPRPMVGHIASPVPGIFGIVEDLVADASEACSTLASAVFVQLGSTNPPPASPAAAGGGAQTTSQSSNENSIIYRSNSKIDTPTNRNNAASSAAASSPRFGRGASRLPEDNPPFDGTIVCSSITFLNTTHAPLPRTASVFRSTLRRGLTAMRSTKTAMRSTEDFLMLFVRYFAVHLGHVGSPLFSPTVALERYRQLNNGRADFKEELGFYERFYQSQTCVQLSEELQKKTSLSNEWTTDTFGNMVVQLNPFWYDSELSKYRKDQLPPVGTKSSWDLLREGSAGSSYSFFACCCECIGGDVYSDDEQGPSRNVSSNGAALSNRSQGLYLTPDGQVATSKETIIYREDMDMVGLSGLAIPPTARESELEEEMRGVAMLGKEADSTSAGYAGHRSMRLAEMEELGTAKLRDAMV